MWHIRDNSICTERKGERTRQLRNMKNICIFRAVASTCILAVPFSAHEQFPNGINYAFYNGTKILKIIDVDSGMISGIIFRNLWERYLDVSLIFICIRSMYGIHVCMCAFAVEVLCHTSYHRDEFKLQIDYFSMRDRNGYREIQTSISSAWITNAYKYVVYKIMNSIWLKMD